MGQIFDTWKRAQPLPVTHVGLDPALGDGGNTKKKKEQRETKQK